MSLTAYRRFAICATSYLCFGCSTQPDNQSSLLLGTPAATLTETVQQSAPRAGFDARTPAVSELLIEQTRGAGSAGEVADERAKIPAFPEAEGYGAFAKGGRGDGSMIPRVIAVTTLTDRIFNPQTGLWRAAPGSLREAVEASGPRFVVFRVAGTIFLETELKITNPYITIAGQTAPGMGISLAHHGIAICASDVVLRYMRVRILFEDQVDWNQAGTMEGIILYKSDANPPWATVPISNIIVDHCSIAWVVDQTITTWHWVKDFTVQWSLISEAAQFGQYDGYGCFGWMSSVDANAVAPANMTRGSMHHNVIAHNWGRNPAILCGSTWDIRNNVIYNWLNSSSAEFLGNRNVNFVGNVYRSGLDTSVLLPGRRIIKTAPPALSSVPMYYLSDNLSPNRWLPTQDQWDIGVYYLLPNINGLCEPTLQYCSFNLGIEYEKQIRMTVPVDVPPVVTDNASSLVARVVPSVGASKPVRDAVDTLTINELQYVDSTYPVSAILPTSDIHLRRGGPHHGPTASVLFFEPRNDPNAICGPRQYRMAPGEPLEVAKFNLLTSLICSFPDGLELPQDASIILDDPINYPFQVKQIVIPDRATVRGLYPEITTPVTLTDSDNDGIPNSMELQIGSNPNVSDAFGDADGDGYLNFEEYLNLLAQ